MSAEPEPLQGPCGYLRGLGLLHVGVTSCREPARGGREARESRGDRAAGLCGGQGGPCRASRRSLRRARRTAGSVQEGQLTTGLQRGGCLGDRLCSGGGTQACVHPKAQDSPPSQALRTEPETSWGPAGGLEPLPIPPELGQGFPRPPRPGQPPGCGQRPCTSHCWTHSHTASLAWLSPQLPPRRLGGASGPWAPSPCPQAPVLRSHTRA